MIEEERINEIKKIIDEWENALESTTCYPWSHCFLCYTRPILITNNSGVEQE